MQDFNSYEGNDKQENGKRENEEIQDMTMKMARAFQGKGEADILRAIYAEAERGRRAGTLTDKELDNFYAAVAPMLDGFKRKKLKQIVEKLKKM